MLPSRLPRRASAALSSSPSLPRRPAHPTVLASLAGSRRAITLSAARAFPRNPRHHLPNSADLKGDGGRSKAVDGAAAAAAAGEGARAAHTQSTPGKRSKPVLPPTWAEHNVSVPKTHAALVAEARAAKPASAEAAHAPAGTAAAEQADGSTDSLPRGDGETTAVEEGSGTESRDGASRLPSQPQTSPDPLQSRLGLLPSEPSLETLQATLITSLLVGAKGSAEASPSSGGPGEAAEEPVVGVYCPVEDAGLTTEETVREVVARIGGDLVVLDAVELCAEGEGALGRATSAIALSPNPLKVRSSETTNNQVSTFSGGSGGPELSKFEEDMEEEEEEEEEEDDEDDHFDMDVEPDHDEPSLAFGSAGGVGGQAQHSVGASEHTRNSRARKPWADDKDADESPATADTPANDASPGDGAKPSVVHSGRPALGRAGQATPIPGFTLRPTESSKLDALFSEIVEAEPPSSSGRSDLPRIIFIKDAHLVAPTFESPSSWYASLKRAVQARRASGRPTSIVLGLGPTQLDPIAPFVAGVRDVGDLPPGLEEIMPPGFLERQAKRIEELNAFVPPDHLRRASVDQLPLVPFKGEWDGHDAVLRARLDKMSREEWGALIPPFSAAAGSSKNGGGGGHSGFSGGFLSSGGRLPGNISNAISNALGNGPVAVMEFPFASASASPLKELLSGNGQSAFRSLINGGANGSSSGSSPSVSGPQKVIWKLVGVFPRRRDDAHKLEAVRARVRQRLQINNLLFTMALADGRGKFVGGLEPLRARAERDLAEAQPAEPKTVEETADKAAGSKADKADKADKAAKPKKTNLEVSLDQDVARGILSWDKVVKLAGDAVGLSLAESLATSAPGPDGLPSSSPRRDLRSLFLSNQRVPVSWEHILRVSGLDVAVRNEYAALPLAAGKPAPSDAAGASTAGDDKGAPKEEKEAEPDAVVEALKKDGSLNKYEKKVLSTIVDRRGLREGFDDVHLPEKTIDAIRSVVSLPLLFPEAFSTGILKNHATSGALLFGPPGTGKTLVVRALAKESGARMMSIQPSDVMDMYFGEAEKLVKAVFSIARKLSPCIVFIDELDALFEARSGGSKGGGDSARRQMLTEFMQEMDGLSSAAKNKDRGLVVIGATNRPQDLDEAVLRRLPRRLMIDLPAEKEREAILTLLLKTETLAPDVDLAKLAKDTATFSGSDLKHLCVMAAQEAIKEQYSVPWSKKVAASPPAGDATSSSTPPPSSPKPAKTPIDVPIVPDSQPAPSPEPAPVPVAPTPTEASERPSARVAILEGAESHEPSTSLSATPSSSSAGLDAPSTGAQEVASEPSPAASRAPNDEAAPDPQQATNADPADGATPTTTPTEPAPTTSSPAKPEPKPRVLTKAHFEYALKNSSSSGSEELGALPELRKWNDQFGDAGSKKNKRSGFGKGFGFGERDPKKP